MTADSQMRRALPHPDVWVWLSAVLVTVPLSLLVSTAIWSALYSPSPRDHLPAIVFGTVGSVLLIVEALSVLFRSRLATTVVVISYVVVLISLVGNLLTDAPTVRKLLIILSGVIYVGLIIVLKLRWRRALAARRSPS
jgi:hypothetical protein